MRVNECVGLQYELIVKLFRYYYFVPPAYRSTFLAHGGWQTCQEFPPMNFRHCRLGSPSKIQSLFSLQSSAPFLLNIPDCLGGYLWTSCRTYRAPAEYVHVYRISRLFLTNAWYVLRGMQDGLKHLSLFGIFMFDFKAKPIGGCYALECPTIIFIDQ